MNIRISRREGKAQKFLILSFKYFFVFEVLSQSDIAEDESFEKSYPWSKHIDVGRNYSPASSDDSYRR
jgi:hypothetical protein